MYIATDIYVYIRILGLRVLPCRWMNNLVQVSSFLLYNVHYSKLPVSFFPSFILAPHSLQWVRRSLTVVACYNLISRIDHRLAPAIHKRFRYTYISLSFWIQTRFIYLFFFFGPMSRRTYTIIYYLPICTYKQMYIYFFLNWYQDARLNS